MRPDEANIKEVPARDAGSMLAAMKRGVAEALRKHRDQGVSIITWDAANQQIVEVPPDQIPNWIDQPTPPA